MIPAELRYTKEHEWVKIDGNEATVGITAFAQSSLGDIVFCELPAVGTELKQHQAFGVVESVKAVSDLYAPLSGTVTAINDKLVDNPAQVNENAFTAWMIKLTIKEPSEVAALLDARAYTALTESGAK
jgi:glycine cleavage system H protein